MGVRLKTKLTLGLAFLFVVILAFGILGIFYINRLSNDSKLIIKDNHLSLVYCNAMLKALEELPADSPAIQTLKENLALQEKNVTEPGEQLATQGLDGYVAALQKNPHDSLAYKNIRLAIYQVQELNQIAIANKNKIAEHTAERANFWLTVIVTILTIVAFTFIVNFPGIISSPIKALSDGIEEIANKNYSKRIYLKQDDEFGELANTFNYMAERLDEYEHSNLSRIMFEKSRIEAIINQMKDGILGFDEKGNVLFINVVCENLLGLNEEEIIGKYNADVAVNNDLMRTLLQDKDKKELKIYADGKESFFNKESIIVKNDAQMIGEVIVLRNITPFHELDEAKTNFIATVSHELKTPMASIKMSLQLLKDNRVGTLSADQQELIRGIDDDIERLLKITGELLNMSQAETGNIQLKLQTAEPTQIVDAALQAVQTQATVRNIHLTKDIAEGLPSIQADIEKTSWVLINLLSNALKYSAESSEVNIRVARHDKEVVFSITDSGRGIEEKYVTRVFDRYFKVPGSIERSGTGLGLAISREFIEAQGGRIWVNSVYGQGSIFSVAFPV